jgi:hypothetical protein
MSCTGGYQGSLDREGRNAEGFYRISRLSALISRTTMSFMNRTISVTDEEFETIMMALDVTAARYEELGKEQPHMLPRAKRMRDTYRGLYRYMENQIRPEDTQS